jgi:hypothetical protein
MEQLADKQAHFLAKIAIVRTRSGVLLTHILSRWFHCYFTSIMDEGILYLCIVAPLPSL